MPRIVGDRFRVVGSLRRRVYLYREDGIFLANEIAYRELAEEESRRGNLNEALEAYKRSLHNTMCFVTGIARMQDVVLLSEGELQHLTVGSKFERLETDFVHSIAAQEVSFDLRAYAAFLDEVRQLERDASQLNCAFFGYGAPQYRSHETGRKLIDAYAKMKRYSDAAWISREIGDAEAQARFKELAKDDVEDNPRFRAILNKTMSRYFSD